MKYAILWIVMAVGVAGCTIGGRRSVSAENDRLRRQVMELDDRVRRVEGERNELLVRLKAAAANPNMVAGGESNLPVATSLDLGFFTGLDPSDGSALPSSAVFYVRPRDGLRRFTQVVGAVTLEVVALSKDLKSDAKTLAATRLSPEAFRDAYRSGASGTYYEVRVPLLGAEVVRGDSVVLRAELNDAATGATHRAEKIVRVK